MSAFVDLGSSVGLIYAVRNGDIHSVTKNTKMGVRKMKSLGLESRTLGRGRRGTFTIEIGEITGSGSVTQVLVNAVNQITGTINYEVGEESDLAAAIALSISTTIAGSGQDYVAQSVGNLIVGYAPVGAPPTINGHVVAVANSGDITITATNVEGVPDTTQVYSTVDGYRFYLNPNINADPMSIVGADEITNILVPQTLDGALPSATVTLSSGIAVVPRVSAISFARLEAQTGNDDTCIGINPVGYADNDLVFASALDEDNAITFQESGSGNLQLKGGLDYISASNVGQALLLRHHEGVFYEVMRAADPASEALIEITHGQGLAAISANQVIPGAKYLITDRGHRGLILTGVTTNRFSLEGQFIAAVPDYQNTTGNFIGDWHEGLTPSVNQIVAYGAGLQYVNTTGNNTSSNPQTDTTNWTLLPRATSTDYVVEIHDVRFNYNSDRVVFRADQRGNTVELSDAARQAFNILDGVNTLDFFWWGKTNANGNTLIDFGINRRVFYGTVFFNENSLEKSYLTSSLSQSLLFRFVGNKVQGSSPNVQGGVFVNSTISAIMFHNKFSLTTGPASSLIQASTIILNFSSTGGLDYSQIASFVRLELNVSAPVDEINAVITQKISGEGVEENISTQLQRKNISALGLSDIENVFDSGDVDGYNLTGVLIFTDLGGTLTVSSLTNYSPVLTQYTAKADAGVVLTLEGTDIGSVAEGDIVIPSIFWDDVSPSGSPSGFAGTVDIDGDKGDYAVLKKQTTSGGTTYFVVESVIQL